MWNEKQAKRAGLVVALPTALLLACSPQPPQETESDNSTNETATAPPLPIVEPPFNRARLLLTVARAASSHALGVDDRDVQRMLDGKRIEVRLRFGCEGQGPGRGAHGWSIDPNGKTLRLRAVPTLSMEDELVRGVAGDTVEAVGGFWLSRPWLLNAACTATEAGTDLGRSQGDDARDEPIEPSNAPAETQRIGIARFFTAEDPRTRQRMDRPFEAVQTLKEGAQVGRQGFNLVLAGRLRAREDGRVILCAGAGIDRPPDCIVSADVDRIWIENPDDKAVMAQWSV